MGPSRGEIGAGALALVAGLLVMGLMVGIVLYVVPDRAETASSPPNTSWPRATIPAEVTSNTLEQGFADIRAAAREVCEADYQAVEDAVGDYQVENDALPTSVSVLRAWIPGGVVSPFFTIAIQADHPGVVEVSTDRHPLAPGDKNCDDAGPPPVRS